VSSLERFRLVFEEEAGEFIFALSKRVVIAEIDLAE
jgi:hypothetical protein